MGIKMKKVLVIIFVLLLNVTAWSQNYPIFSHIKVFPPYTVYLSDYASIASNKMMVTMTLKDPMEANVNITLRLTIRGNGIELRTRDDYRPQPIQLNGGVPLQIYGPELESYLNPANLTFSGISKNEFLKTGKLPEGVYQFYVEALSFDRPGVVLSNQNMDVAWLVLNDPPHWTLPMQNSLLTATYPQFVNFSWMPMNTGSPNAAFTTEYEFTLVELWPEDRAPGDAINSFAPLCQTVTSNTSLVYGPAEPELTPGRKYVCRLRAYDTEGRDLFKNKGYSEILVFTFGQACMPPNTFSDRIISPEEARVEWTSLPGNTQFTLSYSEQNADGTWSTWYRNEGIMPYSNLKELKPEHKYRYQLKAICGTIESEYSEIKEFATPAADTTEIVCGKGAGVPDVDDSPPLPTLRIGDRINAGGFTALVTEAEGSNGSFTGKCILFVKTFGYAPIYSEFTNIGVNQSMQLTSGSIKSVKGELKIHSVDSVLADLNDMLAGDDDSDTDTNGDPNVGDPYEDGDSIIVTLGGEDFIITGDTVIITASGDTITTDFSQIPPIIVVNGDSTDVTTDELDFDGTGGTGTGEDVTNSSSDTTAYSIDYVQFTAYQEPDGKAPGFDAYDHGIEAYRSEYRDKKVNDKEYVIPWQSVEANGKPAKVNMLIDTDVPDSIETRLKVEMKGMPLAFIASPDGDTIKILNLVGQGDKDRDLITASYLKDDGKEVPVGHLNLKSFERQEFKVAIVPVDGSFNYNKNSLKTYLDKVYAPAIVSWNVDVLDPLDVSYDEGEANGLNTSRTFFSSFNEEMKNVIKAMEDRNDYDKNTYYLFVMNKAEDENLNGLMPFNSQYGFIFTGDSPGESKFFRTIAHELGHGVFKLRHNFDHKDLEKRSTQNLMDYTTTPETATVLRKFQWDEIISPRAIALGWSEEKYAEGEAVIECYTLHSPNNDNFKLPETKNEYYTFIAPSGLPFSLSIKASEICFSGELSCMLTDANTNAEYKGETGINTSKKLTSFKLNEKVYVASFTGVNFNGFLPISQEVDGKYELAPFYERLSDIHTKFGTNINLYSLNEQNVFEECETSISEEDALKYEKETQPFEQDKYTYYSAGRANGISTNCEKNQQEQTKHISHILEGLLETNSEIYVFGDTKESYTSPDVTDIDKFLESSFMTVMDDSKLKKWIQNNHFLEEINDKLIAYKRATNSKLYCIFQEVESTSTDVENFAESISSKFEKFDATSMTFMYITYVSNSSERKIQISVSGKNAATIREYLKKSDVKETQSIHGMTATSEYNSLMKIWGKAYSGVPKPHYVYQYTLLNNGDITYSAYKEESKTGIACIYDLRLYYDKKNLIDRKAVSKRYIELRDQREPTTGQYSTQVNNELQNVKIQMHELFNKAVSNIESIDNIFIKEFAINIDDKRDLYAKKQLTNLFLHFEMPSIGYYTTSELKGYIYTKNSQDLIYNIIDISSLVPFTFCLRCNS
jgi:hypothetical protein